MQAEETCEPRQAVRCMGLHLLLRRFSSGSACTETVLLHLKPTDDGQNTVIRVDGVGSKRALCKCSIPATMSHKNNWRNLAYDKQILLQEKASHLRKLSACCLASSLTLSQCASPPGPAAFDDLNPSTLLTCKATKPVCHCQKHVEGGVV